MNKSFLIICIAVVLGGSNYLSKNNKKSPYGFVRMNELIEKVHYIKEANNKLNEEAKKKEELIKQDIKQLQQILQMLNSEKISDKTKKNLENKKKQLITKIENNKQKFSEEIKKKYKEIITPIERLIQEVAKKLVDRYNLTMLEELGDGQNKRYLYIDPQYDYTNVFVKELLKIKKK